MSVLEEAAAGDLLQDAILSPAAGLADLPAVTASAEIGRGVAHGAAFPRALLGPDVPADGAFRILAEGGDLLAVYRADGKQARAEVVMA